MPPGEGRSWQVWHLLAAFSAIMAAMLTAQYFVIMGSVSGMIAAHELRDSKDLNTAYVRMSDYERRHNELMQRDDQFARQADQMRQDIERIERDLSLIAERQAQVRAKLGLMENGGGHR